MATVHARPSAVPPSRWRASPRVRAWLRSPGRRNWLPVPDGELPCMFAEDVAQVAGVARRTIIQFNTDARNRREAGRPRPSDLPAPAGYQRSRRGPPEPYWWPWRIDRWLPARRGPGRPRITETEGAPHDHRRQAAG